MGFYQAQQGIFLLYAYIFEYFHVSYFSNSKFSFPPGFSDVTQPVTVPHGRRGGTQLLEWRQIVA